METRIWLYSPTKREFIWRLKFGAIFCAIIWFNHAQNDSLSNYSWLPVIACAQSLINLGLYMRRGLIYKLKNVQSRRTTCVLTCINVFLCDSVFKNFSVMTREEVKRLAILIHCVQSLRKLETGSREVTSEVFKTLSQRHLHLEPRFRSHLVKHHCFITR